MYKAFCSCGREYIGQSERNLKVRVLEHKKNNSASSLSKHLRISNAHQLESNRTEIMSRERHGFRRKLLESMCILYNPHAICNTAPSVEMSDMWFSCEQRMRTYVAENI